MDFDGFYIPQSTDNLQIFALVNKKTFVFIVNIRVTVRWTVGCANVNKNKFFVY